MEIYRFENLSRYNNVAHGITTKDSSEPFEFSLALHTNQNREDILKNRVKLKEYFKGMEFVVANQTHSSNIEIVDSPQGWESQKYAIRNCDAMITNKKGLMLSILTADCVPILIYDPKKEVVAIVHAGWRGTKDEIVKKTIKKMSINFDSAPIDFVVAIAPSIQRCCYEVGFDVAKYFLDYQYAVEQYGSKYMLDLSYINREQLLSSGVQGENIELSDICTSCESELFFSYRAENGCDGRFMSMIGLK